MGFGPDGGRGRPRRGSLGRTRGPRRSQRGRSSSLDRIGEAGRGGDPWRRRRRGWAMSRRGNGAGEAGTADPGPAGPDPVDPGRVRVKTWPAAANSMASGPYCGELGVTGELLRRAGRGGAEERRRGPGSGSRKFRTTAARASAGLRWACRAGAVEGEEREGGGADVSRAEWVRALAAVRWRSPVGRSEVAEGGGHVRRGRNCPAARGGRRLGFGLRENSEGITYL